MCLYGQDLDELTTPVEAGLTWVIGTLQDCVALPILQDLMLSLGKDRRESGGFIGFDGVAKHLKDGPPRRRVGLIVEGAPARRTSSLIFNFLVLTPYLLRTEGAKIVIPGGGEQIGKSFCH